MPLTNVSVPYAATPTLGFAQGPAKPLGACELTRMTLDAVSPCTIAIIGCGLGPWARYAPTKCPAGVTASVGAAVGGVVGVCASFAIGVGGAGEVVGVDVVGGGVGGIVGVCCGDV